MRRRFAAAKSSKDRPRRTAPVAAAGGRSYLIEALEARLLLSVTAPTGLLARAESNTAISLTWQVSGSPTSLAVQKQNSPGVFTTITTLSGSAVSYVDSTDSPQTSYTYEIEAISGTSTATSAPATTTTLPTFTTTYFVDPVNGNNSNSGTFSSPLLTIQQAFSKLGSNSPGAGIVLFGGTFRETSQVSLPGGSSSAPFTLMAEPGESPVISEFALIPQSSWMQISPNLYAAIVSTLPTNLFVGDQEQVLVSTNLTNNQWVIPTGGVTQNTSSITITDPTNLSPLIAKYGNSLVNSYVQVFEEYPGSIYTGSFIASVNAATGSITTQSNMTDIAAGCSYMIEDVPQMVNAPGDWAVIPFTSGSSTKYEVIFHPSSASQLSDVQYPGYWVAVAINNSYVNMSGIEVNGADALGWDSEALQIWGSQLSSAPYTETPVTNVTLTDDIIDDNAGDGVIIRLSKNVTVQYCLIANNGNGLGITDSSNVLIDSDEVANNQTDGIDVSGSNDVYLPDEPQYVGSSNITISNCYIHGNAMSGEGHSDGIQTYSYLSDLNVLDNLVIDNGKGMQLQQMDTDGAGTAAGTAWSTIEGNVFLDNTSGYVFDLNADTFNLNLIDNTIGGGFGPWILTTGGAIDTGFNFQGNYIFDPVVWDAMIWNNVTLNQYTGNYNFYYSPVSTTFLETNMNSSGGTDVVDYSAISNPQGTGFYNLTGQDEYSQYLSSSGTPPLPAPLLENAPRLVMLVTGDLTKTSATVMNIPGYAVGDYIEIDNDGVARKITSISGDTVYFANNPLPVLPQVPCCTVEDWGPNLPGSLALNLTPTGVAATMGPGVTPIGSSVNVANYLLDEFNGQGVREIPAAPAGLMMGALYDEQPPTFTGNLTTAPPPVPAPIWDIWTGAVSTAWNTGGNWSIGATPTSATIAVINSGSVIASSAFSIGSLILNGGTLQLASGSGMFSMTSLTIDNAPTLDITNNSIVLTPTAGTQATELAYYQSLVKQGYNSGSWTGTGITSSAVAAANAVTPLYGIAVAENDGSSGTVTGLASGQIEIAEAVIGDATLSGTVNFADFVKVEGNYGLTGADWDEGDFFYTGTVNFADFVAVEANFGDTNALSAPEMASVQTSVSQSTSKTTPPLTEGLAQGSSKSVHLIAVDQPKTTVASFTLNAPTPEGSYSYATRPIMDWGNPPWVAATSIVQDSNGNDGPLAGIWWDDTSAPSYDTPLVNP